MQQQDDQKPVPSAVGEDFTIEDQTFKLEEIAFLQARKRQKQQENRRLRDLAEVAAMMDVWTRTENDAYAASIECKNNKLANLQEQCAKLNSLVNRMAYAVTEMQGYMDIIAPYRTIRYNIVPDNNSDMPFDLQVEHEVIDLTSDEELQDDFMTQLMDM